jgi:membrane fusion protein (multidrug efflux system)
MVSAREAAAHAGVAGLSGAAKRSARRRHLAIGVGALALLVAGAWYGEQWWNTGRFMMTTDDAYVGGDVTPIAPHVSGFIAEILVADNQRVHAGEPLLRLDPADFLAAREQARALLAQRQADLAGLQAQEKLQQSVVVEAAADLASRQAQAAFAKLDAARYRSLARAAAGSRQDAERADAATRTAAAAVTAAVAAEQAAGQKLALIGAERAAARAAIAAAEAALRTAQLNLGYTEIDAPIAGYVGDRSAERGAYITAGTNLLSLVPANGLWIDANFKEDEIAAMRPGAPVRIVADVLPGRVFHGRVASLSPATGAVFSVIPPQNATGNFTKIVQRVPVRILLDAADARLGLLRAGLSVTVTVDTRRQDSAS